MIKEQEMFQDLERRDRDLLMRLRTENSDDLAEEILKLSRDCAKSYGDLFQAGFVGEAQQLRSSAEYWAIRYSQATGKEENPVVLRSLTRSEIEAVEMAESHRTPSPREI